MQLVMISVSTRKPASQLTGHQIVTTTGLHMALPDHSQKFR
jgi:hypothetical protein